MPLRTSLERMRPPTACPLCTRRERGGGREEGETEVIMRNTDSVTREVVLKLKVKKAVKDAERQNL